MVNLLNNAAKYTDEGGRIWLSAAGRASDGRRPRAGHGRRHPARECCRQVFDLFTQADRSLDRSQGGLGIGLTLVRRLVEMHGGTRRGHSEGPGKGSEFAVRLPLTAGRRAPPDPAGIDGRRNGTMARGPPRPGRGRQRGSPEMLARLLRLSGARGRTAYDGPAAWRRRSPSRPTWCCWTSVCRGWTATRWPGGCVPSRHSTACAWWH